MVRPTLSRGTDAGRGSCDKVGLSGVVFGNVPSIAGNYERLASVAVQLAVPLREGALGAPQVSQCRRGVSHHLLNL